jgi:hypothetical protein
VLVWGWMGAGSIEDSGYEVHPESNKWLGLKAGFLSLRGSGAGAN